MSLKWLNSNLKRIMLVIYIISLFVFASYLLAQVNPTDPVTTPDPLSADITSFEAYGVIQSASDRAFSMNGQVINIADNAIIQAAMIAGETVRVRGTISPNSIFEAASIDAVLPNAMPGIAMLTGSVTALNASEGRFQLNDTVFFTFNTPLLLDGIQVSDSVRVFAFAIGSNQWSALGVNRLQAPGVSPPASTPDPASSTAATVPTPVATAEISEDFEIVGAIEQIGEGFVVINGQRINTTRARIEDPLTIGLIVEADVYFVGAELFAEEIKPED